VAADFDLDLDESGSTIFTSRVAAAGGIFGNVADSRDEEQIQKLIKVFQATWDSWGIVREKLGALRDLPVGWDTFGGDPIADQTIENALKLVDEISGVGGEAEWVEPTSDGAIALQSHFADSIVRFEIDDSDMVGVAVKTPQATPVYRDIPLGDVAACLGADGR
jgi:hypothetical protein